MHWIIIKSALDLSIDQKIDTNVNITNAKVTISFAGNELLAGSQLGVDFNFQSSQFGGDPTYDDGTQPENSFERVFLFNIQQDYPSVYALATSPEFEAAVSEFVAIANSSCFSSIVSGCTTGCTSTLPSGSSQTGAR